MQSPSLRRAALFDLYAAKNAPRSHTARAAVQLLAIELGADEDIERNAMAILFLKQSTSPVLTGK